MPNLKRLLPASGMAVLLSHVFAPSASALSIVAWDVYNGHTYYVLEAATWTDSEAEAISRGGHLVTVDDAAENAFVVGLALTADVLDPDGRTGAIWLGLSDVDAEGTFVWASGAPLGYTHWDYHTLEPNNTPCLGEPDNSVCAGEDYVHIGWWTPVEGLWNDVPDTSPVAFPTYGIVEVVGNAPPVPEPSTLVLVGLGLAGFVARRRPRA